MMSASVVMQREAPQIAAATYEAGVRRCGWPGELAGARERPLDGGMDRARSASRIV